MIKFFITKMLLLYAGYLSVYWYALFMVVLFKRGESRPVYGSLYTFGGYGEGYFYGCTVSG
jgi:hypothetical protein